VRYDPGSHHPFHEHDVAQVWYILVQYQRPTTGGRPVYDGRFNMTARRPISEENVER